MTRATLVLSSVFLFVVGAGLLFGRPMVLCNFAAGFIGAAVLVKLPAGEPALLRWVLVAGFALQALAFARLLFTAPWRPPVPPAA